MALKFLNKKGWHTGSLRNIETVWKAEQKHEGEQKKLEELRKQIHEERERSEFRQMQEQAGLVPRQERLEFLYDSGLQVGKVSQADEYLLGKPIDEVLKPENEIAKVAATPGALFVEEKPASANDSWRKLHSDPLFLIRQQEQAAIARIKSNPVKMAEIKKDAEMKKKLKEAKKMLRKEAKRERREKKKRKKEESTSSEDSSGSDKPVKTKGSAQILVDDVNGKSRRNRSPSKSPLRRDHSRSPSQHRKDDRKYRSSHVDERTLRSEGGRREHSEFSNQRNRESNDREDNSYSDRSQRSKYMDSDRKEDPRNRRPRNDHPEELRDLDRKRKYDDEDSYRDRSYRGSDRRRDYDWGVESSEARRSYKDEGHGSQNGADGAKNRSYDDGKQRPVHYRGVDSDYENDKRQRHVHAQDTGPLRSNDKGQGSKSLGDSGNGDFKGNYSQSEGAHKSGSYSDADKNGRYGLIKDELTSQGRSYDQSVSGSSEKRDVDDKKGDMEGEGAGGKLREFPVGLKSKPVHKGRPPKPAQLSDAERAARLAEMQSNADLHEEQRWQRLKHAADADVAEVKRANNDKSNEQFMADTRKSIFGAEKFDDASTIEKSVKRRAHFNERSSGDSEKNAFRR